jgi:hypothetical protein
MHDLQLQRGRLADAVDFGQALDWRSEGFGETAERLDQRFGDRFDVAARLGAEEEQLHQLIVLQAASASAREPLAQTLAVAAAVVVRRIGFCAHARSVLAKSSPL